MMFTMMLTNETWVRQWLPGCSKIVWHVCKLLSREPDCSLGAPKMFEVFVSHKPNCYLSAPKKFERLVSWWTVKQTGVTWVFQSCLRGLLLLSREPNCCQAHSCWHATGMKWKHTYQFNKCIYTQIDFRFGPNIQRCEFIREKSQRNDIEQEKKEVLRENGRKPPSITLSKRFKKKNAQKTLSTKL